MTPLATLQADGIDARWRTRRPCCDPTQPTRVLEIAGPVRGFVRFGTSICRQCYSRDKLADSFADEEGRPHGPTR